MQWQTKGQFCGQVKPVGLEKSMGWKMGHVHFDYDSASAAWIVRLYFKVNPTQVSQQIKIGQSANLDVRCGRLMIENKKGDGIHIKLSNSDVTLAKQLVSKINNCTSTTATRNKAEVGFSNSLSSFNHKRSENVSPHLAEDCLGLSLLQASGDLSPLQRSVRCLSKNTLPTKGQGHSAASKRKLELSSPERLDIGIREKDAASSQKFPGNLHGGNSGFGPCSFYGTQKPLSNVDRNTQVISSSSQSFYQSLALKRPKLNSLCSTSATGRMVHASNSESAQASHISLPTDNSLQVAGTPRHRIRDEQTVGFDNLGNTCFLNAPLQCLSALEPLSLDIQSAVAKYGKEIKPNSVTRKLYLLMKDVRRLHVCPQRIKELLIKLRVDLNVKFAANTQQDAHELLSELLNRVDEEVKGAMRLHPGRREPAGRQAAHVAILSARLPQSTATSLPSLMPTPTESNFCWSYRTCIYFHECKTEVFSLQTEQEVTLMLALDSSTKNLQDCINKYFEKTDVQMKCGTCDQEEKATITRKIVRRPRVLILNLLRYHLDNGQSTKKADLVGVPSYINIGEYCAADVTKPAHIDVVFLLDRDGQSEMQTCDCAPSRTESPDALSNVTDDFDNMIADLTEFEHMVPAFNHKKKPANVCQISWQTAGSLSQHSNSCATARADYMDRAQDLCPQSASTLSVHVDSLGTSKTRDLLRSSCAQLLHVSEIEPPVNSCLSPVQVMDCLQQSQTGLLAETLELVEALTELVTCHLRCAEYYVEDAHERGDDISGIYLNAQMVISRLKRNISSALQSDIQDSESFSSCEMLLSEILLKKALMLDDRQLDSLPEDALHLVIEELLVSRYDDTASNEKSMNNLIEDLGLCAAVSDLMTSSSQELTAAMTRFQAFWKKYVSQKCATINRQRGSPDGDSDLDVGEESHVMIGNDIHFRRSGPLKVQSSHLRTEDHVLQQVGQNCVTSLTIDTWSYPSGDEQKEPGQPLSNISLQASSPVSPDYSSYMLQGRHINSFTEAQLQNIDHTSLTEHEMMVYAQALSRFTYEKEQVHVMANTVSDTEQHCPEEEPSCCHGVESETQVTECSSGSSPAHILTASRTLAPAASQPQHKPGMQASEDCRKLCQQEFGGSNCRRPPHIDSTTDHPVMGSDRNAVPIKHCLSCGSQCLTVSAGCSVLDQPVSPPLDASFPRLPAEKVACPISLETEDCSTQRSSLSLVQHSAHGIRPAEEGSTYSFPSDHGSVQSSVAGLKKQFLFSPPKTNNLIKTRDYARLKSPAFSPKKRIAKEPSPKSDCVSKRLHYSENSSTLVQSGAGMEVNVDSNNSEPNTSMEVNVDGNYSEPNTSIDENVDDMPFVESKHTSVEGHQSTPASTSSRHDGAGQILVDCDSPNISPASVLVVEAAQVSPVNAAVVEAGQVSCLSSIQSVMPRHRLVRSLATYIPDIEEKENVHQDQNRGNHNMVNGTQCLSYKLVSVVDHAGSSQFTGHYTAYAFNMSRQKWFHVDDTESQLVTEEEVQEQTTQSGYLFFYMDKDLFDEYSSKGQPASSN